MDTPQPRRRERRVNRQTFYPCPQSFSEPDQYEYSECSSDDESSYEGDGYKTTLVSFTIDLYYIRNAFQVCMLFTISSYSC